MRLTSKDKDFLEKLRGMLDEKGLAIEFEDDGLKRFKLRKNYGDRIETSFHMTRQGVRWRFNRLFNGIYPEAYATILWVESSFGSDLRPHAMDIARQRIELHRKARESLGNGKG